MADQLEPQPEFDRWSRPSALGPRGYVLAVLVPVLIAAAAFGIVSLVASDDPAVSGTTVRLPTSDWQPGDGGDAALIQGLLALDEEHCVYLETGRGRLYAVWPAGWRASRESERLTMYDADGVAVAHDGDTISAGGGFHPVATYAGAPCLPTDGEIAAVQSEVTVGGEPGGATEE